MVGTAAQNLLVVCQQVVVPPDNGADHLVQCPYGGVLELRRGELVPVPHIEQHERGLDPPGENAQSDVRIQVRGDPPAAFTPDAAHSNEKPSPTPTPPSA